MGTQLELAAHLICEFADAAAQDRVHIDAHDVIGVARDDVAQLQPQLVLALALQAAEGVLIHHLGQQASSLPPCLLQG